MHYRFLVTLNKKYAETAKEARRQTEKYLDENGFVGEGRWSRGMADWFIIGGRWSGELSRHSWAKDITADMNAIEKKTDIQVRGVYYSDKEKEQLQQKLVKQFQERSYYRKIKQMIILNG